MRKHVPSTTLGAIGVALVGWTWPPADFWTLFGFIFGIVFIILAVIAWFKEQNSQLNPKKINVIVAHAHDLNYRGATPDDAYRVLDKAYPINIEHERSKRKVGFAFGIDIGKENVGIPLENARLYVNFKREDRLQVEAQKAPDGIADHEWRCHDTNVQYWYDFAKPINERNKNTWTCLFVTFPEPKKYIFDFEITGIGIHEPIKKSVEVLVHPPKTQLNPDTPTAPSPGAF